MKVISIVELSLLTNVLKKLDINLCSVLTLFQGYLEVKIFNRMKKIQNPNVQLILLELVPLRSKGTKKGFSMWAKQPDLPAGETLATLKAFSDENRHEVRKNPLKHKAYKELIENTFPPHHFEIITALNW